MSKILNVTLMFGLALPAVASAAPAGRFKLEKKQVQKFQTLTDNAKKPERRIFPNMRRLDATSPVTVVGVAAEVVDGSVLLGIDIGADAAKKLTKSGRVKRIRSAREAMTNTVFQNTLYIRYEYGNVDPETLPTEKHVGQKLELELRRTVGGTSLVVAYEAKQ